MYASNFSRSAKCSLPHCGAAYVVDMGNRRIQRRSLSDGSVLSQYEARWGRGDGELRSPQGLALLDGLIYVCDVANNRIVCFEDDCTGFKFVRSCTPDEAFGRLHGPTDCAGYVDTDGSAPVSYTHLTLPTILLV